MNIPGFCIQGENNMNILPELKFLNDIDGQVAFARMSCDGFVSNVLVVV